MINNTFSFSIDSTNPEKVRIALVNETTYLIINIHTPTCAPRDMFKLYVKITKGDKVFSEDFIFNSVLRYIDSHTLILGIIKDSGFNLNSEMIGEIKSSHKPIKWEK